MRKILSIELDIEETLAKIEDLDLELFDYRGELENLQEELYQAQQEEERIPGEPKPLTEGDYKLIEKRIGEELRLVIKDIAQSPFAKKQAE